MKTECQNNLRKWPRRTEDTKDKILGRNFNKEFQRASRRDKKQYYNNIWKDNEDENRRKKGKSSRRSPNNRFQP